MGRYGLHADVLSALNQVFLTIYVRNSYVKSFRMMHEVASDGNPNIKMYFKADPSADMQRYNPAGVSEDAAIFSGVKHHQPNEVTSSFIQETLRLSSVVDCEIVGLCDQRSIENESAL